jgi:hypothetical protein
LKITNSTKKISSKTATRMTVKTPKEKEIKEKI